MITSLIIKKRASEKLACLARGPVLKEALEEDRGKGLKVDGINLVVSQLRRTNP